MILPLIGEFILVSPHRAKRPWQGEQSKILNEQLLKYDEKCYLCPGNKRVGGEINEDYKDTFVFDNDFAALLPPKEFDQQEIQINNEIANKKISLFRAEKVHGDCKVVCFSPRHDVTLPLMDVKEILKVIETWAKQYKLIMEKKFIEYVQIFENKGDMMGCSNPHPHSQIWATSFVPKEITKELENFKEYKEQNNKCLLCDYFNQETTNEERIVYRNEHFIAVVPYWAYHPFEILLAPTRHVGDITSLDSEELEAFADIVKNITIRYDNLFSTSFPYSMGFHMSPKSVKDDIYHMHLHFYPPLLRSSTIKKHFVGFELLSEGQRDLTPEQAALRLKMLSGTKHYSLN